MKSVISIHSYKDAPLAWTRRLADSLLKQLASHPVLMDIDVISGAWSSRRASIWNYWEGEPVTGATSPSGNKASDLTAEK